jgi:hypothetical protein
MVLLHGEGGIQPLEKSVYWMVKSWVTAFRKAEGA